MVEESLAESAKRQKVIKQPGLAAPRTAQACDRCRLKKSKCDGKLPTCSSCAAVGMKCTVLHKLSRRAFPKGYTEILEDRLRQVEAENHKLQSMIDLLKKSPTPAELPDSHPFSTMNPHDDKCPCCVDPHTVHEKPVSLAGSVYGDSPRVNRALFDDSESFFNDFKSFIERPSPAPGAFAAATAIEQMLKGVPSHESAQSHESEQKRKILTKLLTALIPRSTEETLFVPTLLAKVCQTFGFSSPQASATASAVALLKEVDNDQVHMLQNMANLILNRHVEKLQHSEAMEFLRCIRLPGRDKCDAWLRHYFEEWDNSFPVVNKTLFLKSYAKVWAALGTGAEPVFELLYELTERTGAIVVLLLSLSLISQKHALLLGGGLGEALGHLQRFHGLIKEFIRPNCIVSKSCSLQLLQILALALQYCLATGDVATCYELRGRAVSMAQQLRLHRCPAAVLGISGTDLTLQKFMQAERRVAFWCVYCLDVYLLLNLGIPRLLKDYEIECAMPFGGNEEESVLVVNNTRLTIFGKVSCVTFHVMRYCKVLGAIMDSIFTRSSNLYVHDRLVERDQILDGWRRELPSELRFEVGADGTLETRTYTAPHWLLIFLYYHAKILIYLPIISKYGDHFDVGLSAKERLERDGAKNTNLATSMTIIQQLSMQVLEVLNAQKSLPLLLNIPRETARFALLVAKGSLEYTKKGPLHKLLRDVLTTTLRGFGSEADKRFPGLLTAGSSAQLEAAILGILDIKPKKKPEPKTEPLDFLTFEPLDPFLDPRARLDDSLVDGSLGLVPFLEPTDFKFDL